MTDAPSFDEQDRQLLVELANTRMPFGKYKGRLLLDLPEPYLAWFARGGFPRGKLGMLLESTLAIKMNGLDAMVRPLVDPAQRRAARNAK